MMYDRYRNRFYNPNDTTKRPGYNHNWEDIQLGFYRVSKAIEESAEHNGITGIEILVDTTGGAITAEITNIDDVADKIGHFRDYPQMVFVKFLNDETTEHVGLPGLSHIDDGLMTALYVSTSGSIQLTQIDSTTWGVSFQNA